MRLTASMPCPRRSTCAPVAPEGRKALDEDNLIAALGKPAGQGRAGNAAAADENFEGMVLALVLHVNNANLSLIGLFTTLPIADSLSR
jgi:hypothetical protein